MNFPFKKKILTISTILTLIPMPLMPFVKEGHFTGRLSRVHPEASLLRVHLDFINMKFLNKNDQVEFWDLRWTKKKCKGLILGKSNIYILVKIPNFKKCEIHTFIAPGAKLHFYSKDLVNNLKMGRELMSILQKKRLALSGQLERARKSLDVHIEKVEAINQRYQVLREKLELEWRKELSLIEEDRLIMLRNYKEYQKRLDEVDFKMEKYRVHDRNIVEDRWALDSKHYYRK